MTGNIDYKRIIEARFAERLPLDQSTIYAQYKNQTVKDAVSDIERRNSNPMEAIEQIRLYQKTFRFTRHERRFVKGRLSKLEEKVRR